MSYFDLMHPELAVEDDRDRSLRAAERYELERALAELDERRRTERRELRQRRRQHFLRLVFGRLA
jgi:hypothetical protein